MTADIITVQDIRKGFGGRPILTGITFSVARGSTFALLGPNGAGKTTMVRMLSTLTRPDAGTATIAGYDLLRQPGEVRRVISLTGQYAAVDELLTASENMRLMARLRHLDARIAAREVDSLMERLDLAGHADRSVKSFSGGMKRKLDLAMSLIGAPEIVFLDEPTTGLDPRSRLALWEMVRELNRTGITIVLTTQYLEEADVLADRVCLIDGGRVVAQGTPADLKRQVGGDVIELTFRSSEAMRSAQALLPDARQDPETDVLRLASDGSAQAVGRLLATLEAAEITVDGLGLHSPSLDDVFFNLTGSNGASRRAEVA